jgi:phenylpyruvate tautomerase PptA (4-oxalocrotonate tautomerase family)
MPLWQIHHSTGLLGKDDRKAMAGAITDLYARVLPRFYVGVVFNEVDPDNLYIGGEEAGDFLRISVDHIARQFSDDKSRQRFLQACNAIIEPYTERLGLRWELHIDETPFELWSIQGLAPPPPNSEHEARWKAENRASPWKT